MTSLPSSRNESRTQGRFVARSAAATDIDGREGQRGSEQDDPADGDAVEHKADEEDDQEAANEEGTQQLRGKKGKKTRTQRVQTILSDIIRFIYYGTPGGLVQGVEFWIFDVTAILIAHMGSVTLDAYMIIMYLVSFLFLAFPFSISTVATHQIVYALQRRNHVRARAAAHACLILGIGSTAGCVGLLYTLRPHLGYLFTGNSDIVAQINTGDEFHLCLGFQFAYGVYGSAQGVLRGTRRQWDILGWTIAGVWITGLALGCYLYFIERPSYGIDGILIGLVVGMGLSALALLVNALTLDWVKAQRKEEYRQLMAQRSRSKAVGAMMGALPSSAMTLRSRSVTMTSEALEVEAALQRIQSRSQPPSFSSSAGAVTSNEDEYATAADEFLFPGTSAMEDNLSSSSSLSPLSPSASILGSTMNPLALMGDLATNDVPLPVPGSRATGGLPLGDLLQTRTDEEMMDEFEYIEFGPRGAAGDAEDTAAEAEMEKSKAAGRGRSNRLPPDASESEWEEPVDSAIVISSKRGKLTSSNAQKKSFTKPKDSRGQEYKGALHRNMFSDDDA